jgi:hypothetical protein
MITLEDVIKEVQGHGMKRVFKKDGEPTKDGWKHYNRLTTILYMVKSLTDWSEDECDWVVGRLEQILLFESTTDKAREKIRERLYG